MGLVLLQNHTQLLNVCIARYPPNHRHTGANRKKSASRVVVISPIKDLSYKLFLPIKEALIIFFL